MKPRDLIFNKAYLTVVGCKIVVSIYSLFLQTAKILPLYTRISLKKSMVA